MTLLRQRMLEDLRIIRFFYSHTLNRKVEIERIPLPRCERKLPIILSDTRPKELERKGAVGPRRLLCEQKTSLI